MTDDKPRAGLGDDGDDAPRITRAQHARLMERDERATFYARVNALTVVPGSVAFISDDDPGYESFESAGVTLYRAEGDAWTNPDEAIIAARVADYRARTQGLVTG